MPLAPSETATVSYPAAWAGGAGAALYDVLLVMPVDDHAVRMGRCW